MVDIAVVRSNSLIYDPRVQKISRSLRKKYSIVMLGWNREGISKRFDKRTLQRKLSELSATTENHFFNLNAPAGTMILAAFLPSYWVWIFLKLCMSKPKVVHSCDFDTIIPCYIYKIIFGKKLVFDVFDRYAMTFVSPKFKQLYSTINFFEELFAKKTDVLITVGQTYLDTFRNKPKRCEVIMNCCEDVHIERTELNDSILTIAFTGHIHKSRGLQAIISVIKDLEGVELIVAGKIADNDLFDQTQKIPNTKYVGLLTPSEALRLEAHSDLMIALYDLKRPQDSIAVPNKLLEAMMCGVPIITNIAQTLIRETNCGVVVEYDNLGQIRSALISMRDNVELRRRLGRNGRKAFLERYNWPSMEQKLLRIYSELIH